MYTAPLSYIEIHHTGMDTIGWLVGQSETLEAQHGRGLWRDRIALGGYFYRFGQQGTVPATAVVENSVSIVAQVRHRRRSAVAKVIDDALYGG
jgi:hypothetical protein